MEVLAQNVEWQGSNGGAAPTLEEAETKVRFLEKMAAKFDSERQEQEAVQALETALFLRRAVLESMASRGTQDPWYQSYEDDLQNAVETLVVKTNLLGVRCFKAGDYESGLTFLNKGMWLTSGADDVNCFFVDDMRLKLRAACLNNLGCLEKKRGGHPTALEYLRHAVALEIQLGGVASPATSMNLCAVLNKLGRHSEALDEANSAITNLLREKHREGGENPVTNHMLCVAYHNLAMSQEFSMNPMLQRAAEDSYSQAMSLARNELGPKHPTTLAIQGSIERFQSSLGRSIRNLAVGALRPGGQSLGSLPADVRGSGFDSLPPMPADMVLGDQMMFPGDSPLGGNIEQVLANYSIKDPAPPLNQKGKGGRPFPKAPTPTKQGSAFQRNRRASKEAKEVPIGKFNTLVPGRPGDARAMHLARVQYRFLRRQNAGEQEEKRRLLAQRLFERERAKKAVKAKKEEQQRKEELALAMYKKMLSGMRQDELRKFRAAAKKIQKIARGFLARRRVERWDYAAVKIQAVVRSWLSRKHYREAEIARIEAERLAALNKAMTQVQMWARSFYAVWWRNRHVEALHLRRRVAARTIQRHFRAWSHQQKAEAEQRALQAAQQQKDQRRVLNQCAIQIQRVFRGRLARKSMEEQYRDWRRRAHAAVEIQRVVRGNLARQHITELKAAVLMYREFMTAAVSIQSWWRGQAVRMNAYTHKELFRVNVKNRRQQDAAKTIQRSWKCYLARTSYAFLKEEKARREASATRIQCFWRRTMALICSEEKRQERRENSAAAQIQNLWRTTKREQELKETEAYYRELRRKEQEELQRTAAAVKIQSAYRGYVARKATRPMFQHRKYQHKCAQDIQRVWKGYHYGRKELAKLKRIAKKVDEKEQQLKQKRQAARRLQRQWRQCYAKIRESRRLATLAGVLQTQQHMRYWGSAVHVENMRRRHVFRLLTRAATTIQLYYRYYIRCRNARQTAEYYEQLRREQLLQARRNEAATDIQRVWRGFAARTRFLAIVARRNRVAARLQRWVRNNNFRVMICERLEARFTLTRVHLRAAMNIQRVYRGYRGRLYFKEEWMLREMHRDAALVIQLHWRGKLARDEYKRRSRFRKSQKELEQERQREQERCITHVQAQCRAQLSSLFVVRMRHFVEETRLERHNRAKAEFRDRMATKIQAAYRGYTDRFYARGLRRERNEQRKLEAHVRMVHTTAVLKLQCFWRRTVSRRVVEHLQQKKKQREDEWAKVQEQEQDPQDLIRNLFWTFEVATVQEVKQEKGLAQAKRDQAATKIESCWRGYAGRKSVQQLLHNRVANRAAIVIQGHWRAYQPKIQAHKDASASWMATLIQCAWRSHKARKCVDARRLAIRQARATTLHTEVSRDNAAVACQCFWRRMLAVRYVRFLWLIKQRKVEAKKRHRAVTDMQRIYRGHAARQMCKVLAANPPERAETPQRAPSPTTSDLEARVAPFKQDREATLLAQQ
mmetsp:Transcript_24608/g.44642  ORF Transcript_24608/g.44642 Transcript_24608/m.44642 type:complete len:1472 (-) Transcript_24608:1462-5877(-)